MDTASILLYCRRAGRFALPAGAACLLLHILWQALRRRKIRAGRECLVLVFAVYLAALLQITVWRGGVRWQDVFAGTAHGEAQLTLFQTTVRHWRAGMRMFLYHTGGNVAWFLPLGFLLPAVRRRGNFAETVLAGLLLSSGIEVLQWLLGTGVADVDDVLLNGLGTALGCALAALFRLAAGRKMKQE